MIGPGRPVGKHAVWGGPGHRPRSVIRRRYRHYLDSYVLPIIGPTKLQDLDVWWLNLLYLHLFDTRRRKLDRNSVMYDYWRHARGRDKDASARELADAAGVTYSAAAHGVSWPTAQRALVPTASGACRAHDCAGWTRPGSAGYGSCPTGCTQTAGSGGGVATRRRPGSSTSPVSRHCLGAGRWPHQRCGCGVAGRAQPRVP